MLVRGRTVVFGEVMAERVAERVASVNYVLVSECRSASFAVLGVKN